MACSRHGDTLRTCVIDALRHALTELNLSYTVRTTCLPDGSPALAVDINHILTSREVNELMRKIAQKCNCELHSDTVLPIYDFVNRKETVTITASVFRDSNKTALLVYWCSLEMEEEEECG